MNYPITGTYAVVTCEIKLFASTRTGGSKRRYLAARNNFISHITTPLPGYRHFLKVIIIVLAKSYEFSLTSSTASDNAFFCNLHVMVFVQQLLLSSTNAAGNAFGRVRLCVSVYPACVLTFESLDLRGYKLHNM